MGWLTTTDHKAIGIAYAVTSLVFLLIGGALAGVIRAELAEPGLQLVSEQAYNSVFTIHGSVMVYLFAVPFGFALANYLVPLQIGAPDLAFPRLNALSYWLYLFGGATMLLGFVTNGGAAAFGWFAYPPLSGPIGSPGLGGDLWIISIILTGTSGTLERGQHHHDGVDDAGARHDDVPDADPDVEPLPDELHGAHGVPGPVRRARHAGGRPALRHRLLRTPGRRVTGALPAPVLVLRAPRGVHRGAAVLRGRHRDLPRVLAKPVFGYKGLVLATLAIAALSTSVWAHHMFATGQVVLSFFAATSFLIAVPTGVKVFTWIGTMWGGSISFEPPMLFALGFLVTFVMGGLTGIMLASPTLDFHLTDTYFVVAHFHYVMGGTVVFALFAAIYFWWPKVTARKLDRRLGSIHFWLLIIGFNMTFFVMHILGRDGMPRRVADYPDVDDVVLLNRISTLGMVVLTLSFVPFAINVVRSLRSPKTEGADPWGGNSLEWATTSPPAVHNFSWLPPIRSERPVFDFRWMNHADVSAIGTTEAWRDRADHDSRWIPLHPWSPEEEPRAESRPDAETGATPAEGARDGAGSAGTATGTGRSRAMRTELVIWALVVAFYTVVGAIYWLVGGDPAGASLLLMGTFLGGLVAGWIWDWRRHHRHPRPQDRVDADAGDETGIVGLYPTASLRPLALGVGITATALGIVLGSWMTIAGVGIIASQVALLTRDADR